MRALLEYLMKGRARVIVAAAIALIVPPFSVVAGGLVGLSTLRYGLAQGAIVLGGSVLLAAAVTYLALGTVVPIGVYVVCTGLPVLGLGAVLRSTSSQGLTLAAAALAGGALVLGIHVLSADPVAWWQGVLEQVVIGWLHGGGTQLDPRTLDALRELFAKLAPLMISLPAGTVGAAMGVVLLARWWHATLDNPGGFGEEFRALRLDRRLAGPTLAIGVLAFAASQALGGLWPALLEVLLVVYAIQGVAISHALVKIREASSGWLVGIYLMLVLMPPAATTALAIVGLSDTALDFRARAAHRS